MASTPSRYNIRLFSNKRILENILNSLLMALIQLLLLYQQKLVLRDSMYVDKKWYRTLNGAESTVSTMTQQGKLQTVDVQMKVSEQRIRNMRSSFVLRRAHAKAVNL